MTERVTGRHRAPDRATTPLSALTSTLSTVVGGHVAGVGRGGLVLAMSSGLVASMGMPAGAATSAPQTGAVPVAAEASTPATGLIPLPASFVDGAAVKAPTTARVTFEHSAFTAVPKPKPIAMPVSRSATRTSLSSGTSSSGTSTKSVSSGSSSSARGSSIIAIAARYLGVPYVYGGSTPNGFDCSGYTKYVYAQAGIKIPRTAEEQRQAARQVARSQAQPGDLVFFLSGGSAYHVGIFAGGNMMYDAGKPGEVITKRAIWSSNVVFGEF